MRTLPLLATSVAVALAVVTTAAGAQDKPKAAAPAKANAGVASKPTTKATAQAPLKVDGAAQKALGEREGSKAYKPAAIGDAPGTGRGYKRGGCDSEGSDA